MKTKIILIILLFAVTAMFPPSMLFAQETSGRVIQLLVEKVDNTMTKLETQKKKIDQGASDLNSRLGHRYKALDGVEDKISRVGHLADIGNILAQINVKDSEMVNAYMDTIKNLVPTMSRLMAEMKKTTNLGFEEREAFLNFRHDIGGVLSNSVKIMNSLELVADETEYTQTKNTLIQIYDVYNSPLQPGAPVYAQIEKSIKDMEAAYAQMSCVARLLEQENSMLKVQNVKQIAHLAMLRLTGGDVNLGRINDVAGDMSNNISDRSSRFMKESGRSNLYETDGDVYSSSDNTAWTKLSSGNPW